MSSKPDHPRHSPAAFILPSQINTIADAKLYFRQRLGSEFRMLPFVKLNAKTYHKMVKSKDGIIQRSGIQISSLSDEILIAPPDKSRPTAIITFAIENPQKLIPLLAKLQPRTPDEKTFVESLYRIHKESVKLHRLWKRTFFLKKPTKLFRKTAVGIHGRPFF